MAGWLIFSVPPFAAGMLLHVALPCYISPFCGVTFDDSENACQSCASSEVY
jgi:hypothetical protein